MVPTKNINQHNSTTIFKTDNSKKREQKKSQHIRMISNGSCNTEDWSNDAEILALITEINYILKCI